MAAGLTPAWQQTLVFEAFELGQVNRAKQAHWCGSGKVLNVGIALARLGVESLTISPLGEPALSAIDAEFFESHVSSRWIRTAAPTRVCTTLLDRQSGVTTELVENAAPLSAAELTAVDEAYRLAVATADATVLTGSLPAETPTTWYRDLLRMKRVPAILDVRGPELLAALGERPAVVKPNRHELEVTVGHSLSNEEQLVDAMSQLLAAGAHAVVVTDGAGPVWVATAERRERLQPPRATQVVNPIGCGDCLAAGIAVGLVEGKNIFDATWFGIAAALENLVTLLPARIDGANVTKRAEQLQAKRGR